MKNLRLLFILFVVSSFCIISCRDESFSNYEKDEFEHLEQADFYGNIYYDDNNVELDGILQNQLDMKTIVYDLKGILDMSPNETERHIDKIHYEVGKLLADIQDENLVNELLEIAKQNNGSITITDNLFHKLLNSSPQLVSYKDCFLEEGYFSYSGYEYKLELFIPNYEVAQNNSSLISGNGFEVYDDIENNISDMIIAWKFTKGTKSAFLIGEDTAMKTTIPLVLPSLQETRRISALPENIERNFTPITEPHEDIRITSSQPRDCTACGISTERFKINHRYDRSRHSEVYEYCIALDARIGSFNDAIAEKVARHGSYFVDKWKIAEVHKNDIGKDISGHWKNEIYYLGGPLRPFPDDPMFSQNPVISDEVGVFYNIYERDWYASNKVLIAGGNWSWDNSSLYVSTRRRYSDQWYAFDPNSVFSNYYIPTYYLTNDSWAFIEQFQSDKGNIWHWRFLL